jgi:hypothetical protein
VHTIDSILSEWSLKSETGIIDPKDLDCLYSILESNIPDQAIVDEVFKNYNNLVNELTIRDDTGKDLSLTLKQSFIDKLRKIEPSWAEGLSEGDEIVRQSTTVTDGEKVKIGSTSLSRANSPGDTSWIIASKPNLVFYIDFSTEVGTLLRRSSKKSEKLQSTDTEALHECFFVVALASQIDSQGQSAGLNGVDSISSLIGLMDTTNIVIKDKEKIRHVFLSRIGESAFSSEVNLRKLDAQKCAEATYQKISTTYKTPSFDYVTRVFEGSNGKKVVADASIKISGEILSISLKYKKGQLNNLKCATVLDNLFGIKMEEKTFMDAIYRFDSEKIDQLLKYFIIGINLVLPPKDKKHYIDERTVTYPMFKKHLSKDEYYPLAYTTISTELAKKDKDAADFLEKYKKLKVANLSNTISRYIESKKTENHNFSKFLTYILRCEPDRSYMYVGDSGKSIYTIPSQQTLLEKQLRVTVEPKSAVDYNAAVKVYVDENLAFEFDINFRWTKSQWVGDMSQVGKNLKAYEINWE